MREKCSILRGIIQDYENPEVVAAAERWRDPAKWQLEIMAGKRPGMEELEAKV